MKTVQLKKTEDKKFEYLTEVLILKEPLVLVFGNRYMLQEKNIFDEVREIFKDGHIVFGSTSGDITSESVSDDSIIITAIEFKTFAVLIKKLLFF